MIRCNDGKCPLVRRGNTNHSHNVSENFSNDKSIDENNQNKNKSDFFINFILLLFFVTVAIASISFDVGTYLSNVMAIEFVNHDVTYLQNMQEKLSEIPSLEQPIFIQKCQSMLISLTQDTFSFYSLATFFMVIAGIFLFRKKIDAFDKEPTNQWMIFKHGKKASLVLIPVFLAIASMFFGFAIVSEQSQEQSIGQILSGMIGNEIGQEDKLLLLEIQLFDTSQNYFKNLLFGFYFLILGASFFVIFLIHIRKKIPNMLSTMIFYGTIIAFVYLSFLFLTSPIESYSNFVGSVEFNTLCEDIVNPQEPAVEEPVLNNVLDG